MSGQFLGNYRAKVVDNKDPEKYGRVIVWIPDIMPLVSDTEGLWARPANNPVGGRNLEDDSDQHFMGTSYIPRKGAWVWIFFEGGNINKPYYFGALDIEHSKVLPENQVGTNYEDKWTIFKSHDGRTIIVSDDPDDERVEITGKKRQLKDPPSGDTDSVYTILDNQTTFLIDERDGKEKILVKTYKGDYINFDIENQKLHVLVNGDVNVKSNGGIFMSATDSINFKTGGNINLQAGGTVNSKAGGNSNTQSGGTINNLASGLINLDGVGVNEMTGSASPADDAGDPDPNGDR